MNLYRTRGSPGPRLGADAGLPAARFRQESEEDKE